MKIFKDIVTKFNKKYLSNFTFKNPKKIKKNIKSRDMIRIKNLSKKINTIKNNIYEYILLDNIELFLKEQNIKEYYSLTQLLKNNIININSVVLNYIDVILNKFKKCMREKMYNLIKNSEKFIEKNLLIKKHRNIELYNHQKEIITICKDKKSKLILYQAPTGMGKTLSPIGLVKNNKIIFMCTAKHVGLQLRIFKSDISLQIPIAIAFGCNDISDIRLHYFVFKDFVKHRKSGQIFRVDNSVGDKVEMIICDIQSYLYAMRYMQSFNNEEEILMVLG